ncbi:MAG: hypothetical protein ACOZAK_03105 [Patescibacteria group bacterium]
MIKKLTITGQINAKALELLEQYPAGLSWTDLKTKLEETYPAFHPKTINGCVWKLLEKYPDQVYKPKKGLFRLKKF